MTTPNLAAPLSVTDLGSSALIRGRFGFEARFSHFPLFGLCERCSAT